ncbi:MAG: hypothetical protein RL238_2188 [Actinomycetota bacterium]|jgi:hypothetical protein
MADHERPSIDDDLAAIASWAGTISPPDHETLVQSTTSFAGPRESGPGWQRGLMAAAAVLMVVVGVWALTRNRGHEEVGDIAGPAAEWTRTAQSPLSPRNAAKSVWTGSEVIVFGGTTQPECPMCDYFAYGDTLRDGAAYDPATDTWRPIADLPAEASYVGTAVAVDGDVYYYTQVDPDVENPVTTYALFQYSVADDTWTPITLPGPTTDSNTLVAGTSGLLLPAISPGTDWWFDLASQSWTEVPEPPDDGTLGRQYIAADGDLVAFSQGYERLGNGADVPFWHTARLDLDTMTWQALGTVEMMYTPVFAEGTRLVSPFTGGVDGGEVNNWGRTVPNGGVVDIATGAYSALPQPEPDYGMGVIGTSDAWVSNSSGSVLDLPSGRWLTVPTLPDGLDQQFGQSVTAMGVDVFTFGGNVDNELHNASYVWRTRVAATPDTTGGATPSTAPPLKPGETIVEQQDLLLAGGGLAALDEALRSLGIDQNLAPWNLFSIEEPVFCGAEWIRDPYATDVAGNVEGRDCFSQAVADGSTALYIFQSPTVEGAPIAWVWRTENGQVSQHVDMTRDPFGSGEWSSSTCFTFERAAQGVLFDCGTIAPAGTSYTLAPAGGCGAMGFHGINSDQTVALMIYLGQGDAVAADLDRTFNVGDPDVYVVLRRGVNLGEMMCNDVISESRVDAESPAVGGTIHVTTSGTGAETCGDTSGLAEVTGLVFEDGTTVDDLEITTTELNCFAG